MSLSAVSDLGLHCLPMSFLWGTGHKWLNFIANVPVTKKKIYIYIYIKKTSGSRESFKSSFNPFILIDILYIVCLSLLTMTNPNQLCAVLLFISKMADETNFSCKLPVADRTREV